MTTVIPQTKPVSQKMDDEFFQQFFQSLASEGSASSEQPWLAPEWFSGQQSVHSTPEIATPQDMFLTSPTTEHCGFEKQAGFADLDVSAILNTPLVDVPIPPPAAPASADLHAALAALATVTQSPVQSPPPVAQPSPQQSPVIDVTPAFSTRKRKSESEVSPTDEAAIKRQKNTDAARRSRLRKVMKMEGLEKRVAELEKTNTTLLLRAAVLESEKTSLLAKEASYEQRIKSLEAQLAQAHQSLAGIGPRQ
ncbi:hypothetical protein BJV82DRAFT_609533 [Fennellomyces sp. T-0311]|nr:hypothetical protein BJV82DRAFT_609533 [Fennellomyces sp. T-0311]